MPAIGIDDSQFFIYEGDGHYGRPLWPSPVLSIATIVVRPEDAQGIPNTNYLAQVHLVFREDSFDPVTRIRRGRLYMWRGTNPEDWEVPDHPVYKEETGYNRTYAGLLRKRLYSFHSFQAFRELGSGENVL